MELRKVNNRYVYNSPFIKKFINSLSRGNKVQQIERSLFISLANLKLKIHLNPLILFFFLLNEIKPCIVLKSLRLGSVVYQIPAPLVFRKQLFKAIKLLVRVIKMSKQIGSLEQKLETELFLILRGKSPLLKLNQTLYQTASNARAFAHYRWD